MGVRLLGIGLVSDLGRAAIVLCFGGVLLANVRVGIRLGLDVIGFNILGVDGGAVGGCPVLDTVRC